MSQGQNQAVRWSAHSAPGHAPIHKHPDIPCSLDDFREVSSRPDTGAISAHYGGITGNTSTCQDRHQRSRVDGLKGNDSTDSAAQCWPSLVF